MFRTDPQELIALIDNQKELCEKNGIDADLQIKGCSGECLIKLAEYYHPQFTASETIVKPSKNTPYFYFGKKISDSLRVTFHSISIPKHIQA